jgi:hypothetical protein
MSCKPDRKVAVLGMVCGLVSLVGVGGLGGCSSLPPQTGPTVGVRNDSDAPLRATFWIGDRDEQRAGAKAEMQAQETMEIPPYGTKQFRLGTFSGYDSPTESFVRVQIQPVGATFVAQPQHWYELNPPSPYTIRVHGLKPGLQFERVGGGTMAMVPPELWFMNATPAMMAASGARPPIQRVNAQPTTAANTTTKPSTATNTKSTIKRVDAPGQTTGVPTE